MDTFCVLPWFSQEIRRNSITACCLLPENHNIESVRKDLLQGIKSSACDKCWKIESVGLKSRRQQENEFLDYKLDRDISLIREDCLSGNSKPVLYQIMTSNTCNQACVTCDSTFSSKWAEIEKRQGLIPRSRWVLKEKDRSIDYQSARRISLLGGEPLFDRQTFEILDNLHRAGNQDCFISLITNGSIKLSQTQKNLLEKFNDLNICVSIDGIEKRFEYMRWPTRWNDLVHNLDTYRKLAKTVSVSYTISSLNAIYYEETARWFAQQGLSFNHNVVTHPDWLALERAPEPLLTEIKKIPEIGLMLSKTESTDLDLYRENLRSQDQAKKIRLENYLPEVANLIDYIQ